MVNRIPIPLSQPPSAAAPAPDLHLPVDAYADGSPISLSASIVVAPNNESNPNVISLNNPTPHAIEISELEFHLSGNSNGVSPGAVNVQLLYSGQNVQAAMTNDFIPLWLLDQSRQLYAGESKTWTDPEDSETAHAEAHYLVRFNTPVHLEPKERIDVQFLNTGLVNVPINCQINQKGRVSVGSPVPQKITLPYFAVWIADSVDMQYLAKNYGTDNGYTEEQESTETQLTVGNGITTPVRVLQLTGRLVTEQTSGGGNTQIFSDEVQDIVDTFFNVNIYTSSGYEITKEFVPFRMFFGRDTRSMPMSFPMDPGDYIIVELEATMGNIAQQEGVSILPALLSPVTPQVGLVGEYEVQR